MRLAINIDHVATLRNARGGDAPSPAEAAGICESAGADGIVCHLREDRRHIRDKDVILLRKTVTTKLDLEMAAAPEIIRIALRIKPDLVTLVPEKREELTTEGGLNVAQNRKKLGKIIRWFQGEGILVSLFVDPDRTQIEAASEIGSDMVELHTGEYANAATRSSVQRTLHQIKTAARLGKKLGMTVNAGHGLDYLNTKKIAKIKEIEEVSIGHAVMVRALIAGLGRAVREMKSLVS